MRNYNKTPYINAKGDDYTMSEAAIRDILLSLNRDLGGKNLTKATIHCEAINWTFDADNPRVVPRMNRLLVREYTTGQDALNIPSSDIKTIDHRQYGKNHVIHICDTDDNYVHLDLWVA